MLLVEFLLGQNGLGALGHFARLLIVQPAVAFSTRLGILLPGKPTKNSNILSGKFKRDLI
jgi:hypothetical protein